MAKPKVAFFDFACCEGCQLQVANIGEALIDILDLIEVVEFREVMSEKWDKAFDVAIIEGSITTEHAERRAKKIRERSSIVVAYGACAAIGGVNGMKNNYSLDEVKNYVYKDGAKYIKTTKTKALNEVIKVDYTIHGCPVFPKEFITVIKAVLAGVPYQPPRHAVCVECKFNENECMYDRGITCMGPITRAGCNSWCVNNGNTCFGCRGILDNPNKEGYMDVLSQYNISVDFIKNKMKMYNTCGENE